MAVRAVYEESNGSRSQRGRGGTWGGVRQLWEIPPESRKGPDAGGEANPGLRPRNERKET